MKKIIIFALLVLFILAATGQAQPRLRYAPYGPTQHLNIAQMGMGGLTSVVYSNAHTPFYNPALLARQKFNFEIAPVSVGIGGNTLGIASFVGDHSDEFAGFDALSPEDQSAFLKDAEEFDMQWQPVQFSPYIGMAFKHFGFGAYSVTQADLMMDLGVVSPALGLRGYSDLVAGFGYGQNVEVAGIGFDAGFTLKYVHRQVLNSFRVAATDVGDFETADGILTTFQDELEDSETGFGIDLGAAKTVEWAGSTVDLGFVVQDILMNLEDGGSVPNFKFGSMYHVPVGEKNHLLNKLDVGAEWVDMMNREGNKLFQKINIGAEMSLIHFLRLRGGFHQGYPTFGFGLNFWVISLDFATFARELGDAPGVHEERIHRVQLSIGWTQ